jgi:hypothetical protein
VVVSKAIRAVDVIFTFSTGGEFECRIPYGVIALPNTPLFVEAVAGPDPDPLDSVVDGETLRDLLSWHEKYRRTEQHIGVFSRIQREAISAHWSAELRAKVAASEQKRRNQVLVDLECVDGGAE